MKYIKILSYIVAFLITFSINAQHQKNIYIPDIPGYQTLKCDFHMHTVFSDGTVWPTVRVAEAWLEGLDVIAISDHIEYHSHSTDIIADQNRSFDIAKPIADRQGIILVKATEVTKQMPPGHFNALFITNANLMEFDDAFDALKEAKDQGAFIFWNHPNWKAQQPDTTLWWDEHTRLFEAGLLHGIEVYNTGYSPEALNWTNEKNLAVLCNSDEHGPMNMSYNLSETHRPMTLVFTKEKTENSLKEALFENRSVAYFGNTLMGPAEFLEPLFFASIEIEDRTAGLTNKSVTTIKIKNTSDVDYELQLVQPPVGFNCPENITIPAHHSTNIELEGDSDEISDMKSLKMYYQVNNMFTKSDSNLVVT
ncbi:MAG: histidinol-phosphatase, partial [Mariniphaga sp.]|nr:histidinol-phosphatase [Mariniphaga sp.]